MIKELAVRFFSAFSKPAHVEQEIPVPIEQGMKGWNIKLSCRSLTEKVNEANEIKPFVMQESSEHLKCNEGLMGGFLSIPHDVRYWNNFDRIDSPDKKWRVRE